MERFIADSSNSPDDALARGVQWLVERAARGADAAISVDSVASIENLAGAIGRERAEEAKNHRQVRIDGAVLQIIINRQRPVLFNGPLLVPWANEGMLAAAEALEPTELCATVWAAGELDRWKEAFAPIDLSEGPLERQPVKAAPPIRGLVAGLVDVLHPLDKKRALIAPRAIRQEDIEIDPVLTRAAAIEAGWAPRAADRLRDLAERVASGRPIRGAEVLGRRQQRQLVERLSSAGTD